MGFRDHESPTGGNTMANNRSEPGAILPTSSNGQTFDAARDGFKICSGSEISVWNFQTELSSARIDDCLRPVSLLRSRHPIVLVALPRTSCLATKTTVPSSCSCFGNSTNLTARDNSHPLSVAANPALSNHLSNGTASHDWTSAIHSIRLPLREQVSDVDPFSPSDGAND
jgi:hypothetical protein